MNRCDTWLSRAKECVCTLHLFFAFFFLSRGVSFFPLANFSRLKIPQRCDETAPPASRSESDCLRRHGMAGVFIVCPFSSDFTQLKLESRSRSTLREKNLFLEHVRGRSTSCGVAGGGAADCCRKSSAPSPVRPSTFYHISTLIRSHGGRRRSRSRRGGILSFLLVSCSLFLSRAHLDRFSFFN